MSQEDAILGALRRGERLTAMVALDRYGCLRLAARVYDLRATGHRIAERTVEANGKRFSEYWMDDGPELFPAAEIAALSPRSWE